MGEQFSPDAHGTEAVVEAVGEHVRLTAGSPAVSLWYTTAEARQLAAALVEAASQLEALRHPGEKGSPRPDGLGSSSVLAAPPVNGAAPRSRRRPPVSEKLCGAALCHHWMAGSVAGGLLETVRPSHGRFPSSGFS